MKSKRFAYDMRDIKKYVREYFNDNMRIGKVYVSPCVDKVLIKHDRPYSTEFFVIWWNFEMFPNAPSFHLQETSGEFSRHDDVYTMRKAINLLLCYVKDFVL
jgi:hypothetical protein